MFSLIYFLAVAYWCITGSSFIGLKALLFFTVSVLRWAPLPFNFALVSKEVTRMPRFSDGEALASTLCLLVRCGPVAWSLGNFVGSGPIGSSNALF